MTTDANVDTGERAGIAAVTGRAALGPRPDPSPALVAAARAAASRMAGLAFVNPALAVEAVAFAPWNGHWLGVLLTPWSMNLVLAPRDRAAWPDVAPGAKLRLRFPAGDYDFVGARDDVAGETLVCSLFSPVLEFEDQATARLVAELAREALFDPAHAEAADGSARARRARAGDGPSRRSNAASTRRCRGATCCADGSRTDPREP